MSHAESISQAIGREVPYIELQSRSQFVSQDEIGAAGFTLQPARYLSTNRGQTGNLATSLRLLRNPTKNRLADYFDIIRPKATTSDPVGELLWEIRAGNLTEMGEITPDYRKVTVRETKRSSLEEQRLRNGDILFAHRGPIGRVAYVWDKRDNGNELWASQSVMIIRAKKMTSSKASKLFCDHRALFMYLLNEEVRQSWSRVAIGDRSPAIPIGEIERMGIPNNLITARGEAKVEPDPNESFSALVDEEFKKYRARLDRIKENKILLKEGLQRIWKVAWQENQL